jgi:hypothetical protein
LLVCQFRTSGRTVDYSTSRVQRYRRGLEVIRPVRAQLVGVAYDGGVGRRPSTTQVRSPLHQLALLLADGDGRLSMKRLHGLDHRIGPRQDGGAVRHASIEPTIISGMAQRIQTLLTDDLDPELEASQTIAFGLDGTSYEIDLTDEHSVQLREAFEPYVAAARKVGRTPGRGASRPSGRGSAASRGDDAVDPGAVRAWAKERGISVSERGRVKGSVVAQFIEATR